MDDGLRDIMDSKEVLKIFSSTSRNAPLKSKLKQTIQSPGKNYRPNTVSVEDVFFGDSGKGSVVAKFNDLLSRNSELVSLRFNGGANAGHETMINGKMIVMHQLPVGVVCEGSLSLIGRGMVVHPEDLLEEIRQVKQSFNGELPGKLLVDERVTLSLDTHRVFEGALNSATTGGRGSTGRGIATGYGSHYERFSVTMKDLLSHRWEDIFRAHYRLYKSLTQGLLSGKAMEEVEILTYTEVKGEKRLMGTEDDFIKRLKSTRSHLKRYVINNMYDLLNEKWRNPKIAVTIEAANGPGLDPYHGVYPDVTSSRPMSRFVNDSTYNIIMPEDIFFRVAVMKTTYMSSVGKRELPDDPNSDVIRWIQEAFDERGRTSGRLRDIYPVSLPIAQYLRLASGYTCIAATHLDASKEEVDINVVSHYTEKMSGKERGYFPYQDHLDDLDAHFVTFKGWDGEAVKKIKSPDELPVTAKKYLSFLDKVIAPVVMATTGPDLSDYITWW